MFECDAYNDLYVNLFNRVLHYPNFIECEKNVKWQIMVCDKNIISKTGKYICNPFEKRNAMYKH